jgi:hypothetical protein
MTYEFLVSAFALPKNMDVKSKENGCKFGVSYLLVC